MPFPRVRRVAVAAALLVIAPLPAYAVAFDFSYLGGTSSAAKMAFQTAAGNWSRLLTDPVTVKLTVGTSGQLGSGVLASAGSYQVNFAYSQVRAALGLDATSATDATVLANLPGGNSVPLLINYTSDNPHGVGSPEPYLDDNGSNNNITIGLTSANARALGLVAAPGAVTGCIGSCDGSITFSNAYSYDYDRGDGITVGAFDLIGLAEHEIGHALGFLSGVDILDRNSPNGNFYYAADNMNYLTTLDLFRCSAASHGTDIRDFTAGREPKYFSIDGCNTRDAGGVFSTGVDHGDGNQAGHWKDGQSPGLMDAIAAPGEHLLIARLDLQAFDAIGWDLASVPEPASLLLLGAALAGMGATRRRRDRFRCD